MARCCRSVCDFTLFLLKLLAVMALGIIVTVVSVYMFVFLELAVTKLIDWAAGACGFAGLKPPLTVVKELLLVQA